MRSFLKKLQQGLLGDEEVGDVVGPPDPEPAPKPKTAGQLRVEREKEREAKRRTQQEEAESAWDQWRATQCDGLQLIWEQMRDKLLADHPHESPFRISQDQETGWWRVSRRKVEVHGCSPMDHWNNRYSHLRYHIAMSHPAMPYPPLKIETPEVWSQYVEFEPTFKTFAEADDWAKETATLGPHHFGVGNDGVIETCSAPEGVSVLSEHIQAAHAAKERAKDRASAYEDEALF